MRTRTKTKNFFAPRATGLGGAVTRAAVTLALMMLTTATAWAQGTIYLSLDKNDGTGEARNIPVSYDPITSGYHYTLSPTAIFTRDGHSIIAWNTSPTRTGTEYGASETITMTESMTLYAIWDDIWNAVPEASYELSPTAYTLAGDGYTDITCTLTSLVLGRKGNNMAEAIVFYMNGGTLSDGNGHSIAFKMDNPSHNGLGDYYQGDELSSQGEQFVVAVYIAPADFAAAEPGTYKGTLTYGRVWIYYNGGIYDSFSGSIALTLVVPARIADGDDVTVLSTLDGMTRDVELTRTFPAGKKQTVCLPFAPDALLSLGTVWEFTGISDGKAVMTERTSGLQANTPYIFKANASNPDVTSILFPSAAISIGTDPQTTDGTAGFTFHGTYTQKTWEADEAVAANIYGFMMQENDGQTVGQFVKARRKTILRPFSCYLEYSGTLDGTQTAAARRATRADGETLPDVIDIVWLSASGEATGIRPTPSPSLNGGEWYDLLGRRLSAKPSQKGLYINNGRKVVIK
ncbi:MAG: InlB B-repeat-containing protein [Prevotella sp.]|nr:InlB B-repeat-containing protein [Prevotella sp.]